MRRGQSPLSLSVTDTWNTYFGVVGGSPPSEPSGSDHKHRELVEADQLVATEGFHWKEAQTWHLNTGNVQH